MDDLKYTDLDYYQLLVYLYLVYLSQERTFLLKMNLRYKRGMKSHTLCQRTSNRDKSNFFGGVRLQITNCTGKELLVLQSFSVFE